MTGNGLINQRGIKLKNKNNLGCYLSKNPLIRDIQHQDFVLSLSCPTIRVFSFLKSIRPFSKNKATKLFDFAVDYHRIIFQNISKYLKVPKSLLAKRATVTRR